MPNDHTRKIYKSGSHFTSFGCLVRGIVRQESASGGGDGRLDGPGDRLQLRVGRADGQALGVHGHLVTLSPRIWSHGHTVHYLVTQLLFSSFNTDALC